MAPHSWTLVIARHKQDVRGHRCPREGWSCIPMPDTGAKICGYVVWLSWLHNLFGSYFYISISGSHDVRSRIEFSRMDWLLSLSCAANSCLILLGFSRKCTTGAHRLKEQGWWFCHPEHWNLNSLHYLAFLIIATH